MLNIIHLYHLINLINIMILFNVFNALYRGIYDDCHYMLEFDI